jgi:hypothetical protein
MASNPLLTGTTTFILSGTIHWAFLAKKDNYGKYSFDLVLDPECVQTVQDNARGFAKASLDKYGGNAYIKVRSDFPFRVLMDTDNPGTFSPVAPDKVPLVGNGSKVRVKMVPFTTKFGGKVYNKANCQILQIVEFIPYESKDQDPLSKFYDFGTGTPPVSNGPLSDPTMTTELSSMMP